MKNTLHRIGKKILIWTKSIVLPMFILLGINSQGIAATYTFEETVSDDSRIRITLTGNQVGIQCGLPSAFFHKDVVSTTVTGVQNQFSDYNSTFSSAIRGMIFEEDELVDFEVRFDYTAGMDWAFRYNGIPMLSNAHPNMIIESSQQVGGEWVIKGKIKPVRNTRRDEAILLTLRKSYVDGFGNTEYHGSVLRTNTVYREDITPLGTAVSPSIPWLVLHDPPGDASYSYMEESKEICREFSLSYEKANEVGAYVSAKLGVKGETSAGFIVEVGTEFEAYVEGTASGSMGAARTGTNTYETCITMNSLFSTSAYPEDVQSDVFVGYGITYQYGIFREATHTCGLLEPEEERVLFAPDEVTNFVLTEKAIKDDIVLLRDAQINSTNDVEKSKAKAQADLWERILANNDLAKVNAEPISGLENQTFDAGPTIDQEWTVSTTEISEVDIDLFFEGQVSVDAKIEVAGSGVGAGYYAKARMGLGSTSSNSTDLTQTIGYHIEDDDISQGGDRITTSIRKDKRFGTPVFFLNETSSRTSCPYEGGYQMDQPEMKGLVNGVATDFIEVQGNPGEVLTIPLQICNNSIYNRSYELRMVRASNVNGAVVKVGGENIGTDTDRILYSDEGNVNWGPNTCFNVGGNLPLLTIQQDPNNPAAPSDYELIQLILSSCGDDQTSTIYINAYFDDPGCQYQDLTQNQDYNSSQIFRAKGSIVSDAEYGKNSVIQLVAQDGITLGPSSEIEKGALIIANIDDCTFRSNR